MKLWQNVLLLVLCKISRLNFLWPKVRHCATSLQKISLFQAFPLLFENWRIIELLYKILLFLPCINKNESWFIHMSPLSWISLPHPTPQGCHRAPDLSALHYTASLLWLILHVVMYMFQCYSQFLPSFPSPPGSTSLFSMSVSPLLHWQVFWEPGYIYLLVH